MGGPGFFGGPAFPTPAEREGGAGPGVHPPPGFFGPPGAGRANQGGRRGPGWPPEGRAGEEKKPPPAYISLLPRPAVHRRVFGGIEKGPNRASGGPGGFDYPIWFPGGAFSCAPSSLSRQSRALGGHRACPHPEHRLIYFFPWSVWVLPSAPGGAGSFYFFRETVRRV